MKGDASSRQWTFTLQDIAETTGLSIEVVRDHKLDGRLKPWLLSDLAEYIIWKRFEKEKK
jgi:hypothetical protein